MIAANELRIGNWLQFTDSPHQGNLKIDSKVIAQDELSHKEFNWFFAPIPLTEQWLLKFGFEKDISITTRNIYCKGSFAIIQTISGNNYFYEGTELKFVHSLQNLYFALTQKELEINE